MPKQQVILQLNTTIEGDQTSQRIEGELYRKDGSSYIRYPENEAEMGRTTTTLKVAPDHIKLIRHGDVQTEMTFIPGERRHGFLITPNMRLTLDTSAHRMESAITEQGGRASWEYDLYLDGELAGTYAVEITILEEQNR